MGTTTGNSLIILKPMTTNCHL